MKNIATIIKYSFLATLFFASCDKEEETLYDPMVASAMNRSVYLSISNTSGEDLLANNPFGCGMSVYGELSKKEKSFDIVKMNVNGIERRFLRFEADLPDRKQMKFYIDEEDRTIEKGTSSTEIKVKNSSTKLICNYKYSCSKKEFYGNSAIIIESVECQGEKVERGKNDIILNFTYVDGKLILK